MRTPQQYHNLVQLLVVAEQAPEHLLHMNACVEQACGTARCLLGWAIIDPWLREHAPSIRNIPIDYNHSHFPISLSHFRVSVDFGITPAQSRDLFNLSIRSNPHKITKRMVTERIKKLLKGQNITPYRGVRP